MSHTLTDEQKAIVQATAAATVDQLILKAQDPTVAEKVMDTWGDMVHKVVGRAVVRFLWIVLFGCVLFAGWKTGLLDRLYKP